VGVLVCNVFIPLSHTPSQLVCSENVRDSHDLCETNRGNGREILLVLPPSLESNLL